MRFFFDKPFYVGCLLFSTKYKWVFFGFAFGHHKYVDMLAEGWEFHLIPPQNIKNRAEGEKLKGLEWRKITNSFVGYALENTLNIPPEK